MRRKYVDFQVNDSMWKQGQPHITIPIVRREKSVEALLRWNPGRYKTEWRIRLTNSHTREKRSYPLTKVIYRKNWMIVCFNTDEAIDSLIGVLPVVLVSTILLGMTRHMHLSRKEKVDAIQELEKEKQ